MLCATNATYPVQRPQISGVEHTINAVNEVLIVDKVHTCVASYQLLAFGF